MDHPNLAIPYLSRFLSPERQLISVQTPETPDFLVSVQLSSEIRLVMLLEIWAALQLDSSYLLSAPLIDRTYT